MRKAGLGGMDHDRQVPRAAGILLPVRLRGAIRVVAAVAVATIPVARVTATPPHANGPVPAATQTLHDAVAAAWARLPQRRNLTARQASAAARYLAGGALVPNAPTATGSFVNDRIAGSNYDYITSQVGVSTPVWLPGEGTATQAVARADMAAGAAAIEAEHLALAAQVLDYAVQATTAANARDVASRRLATDQALAADLARQFRLGEASESDALAADAEAAGAAVSLQTAQAQFDVALVTLGSVTGTEVLPRLDSPEPLAPVAAHGDPLAGNARVAAAEQAVAAARANARLVRLADRDDPEIGLLGINEKQPGTRWDTRFGVTMTFHFATEARNAPRRAEAEQSVTEAEVQLALVRREVVAATRQAAAVLAGAERGSASAARAAGELERRRGQIERAWRAGEMPLIEVVRANALAFDAAYARDKARIDLDAARLRLRLAGGSLP